MRQFLTRKGFIRLGWTLGAGLLAGLPEAARAMAPSPYQFVPIDPPVVVEVDEPPGRGRFIIPFDFTPYPDPVAVLVRVSNRGKAPAGLMDHPTAPRSALVARPGHSVTGRLFVPEDDAAVWYLPGVRRARMTLTFYGVWIFR